jgi:glycosyltransferase involved in cell wall biosynthesis
MGAGDTGRERIMRQTWRADRPDGPELSVVVPMCNEEGNLRLLAERVRHALSEECPSYELIFVDDGSADGSVAEVRRLAAESARVRLVVLSRNFGKEAAMLAGYDHSRGRAIIVVDADLQHPPELFPTMLAMWRHGYDVVNAVRTDSRGVGGLRGRCSAAFYWLNEVLTGARVPPHAGDFRLMDRAVVEAVRRCREHHRFNRTLVGWAGFRHLAITYQAAGRHSGQSKWSGWGLFLYALDGIFSFSFRPLRLVGLVGGIISLLSLAFLLIVASVWAARPGPGGMTIADACIIGLIALLGGTQLLGFWLLGEYVGRTYEQVKGRPPYVVRETLGQEAAGLAMPRIAQTGSEVSDVA